MNCNKIQQKAHALLLHHVQLSKKKKKAEAYQACKGTVFYLALCAIDMWLNPDPNPLNDEHRPNLIHAEHWRVPYCRFIWQEPRNTNRVSWLSGLLGATMVQKAPV